MTDSLSRVKELHDSLAGLISRNQTAFLNKQPLDPPATVYKALAQLVEATFVTYQFDFYLAKDYFRILAQINSLYQATDREVKVRLLAQVQLMISNLKSSRDLNETTKLDGFRQFFSLDFGFDVNEEVADYFINIAKSMILKADDQTDAGHLRDVLQNILRLHAHRDNLVKTTVRNIILAVIRLTNPSFVAFVHSDDFKRFVWDVLREVGRKVESTDGLIVEEKVKELQDVLYCIQENLQFLDEICNCTVDPDSRRFVANSFVLMLVVHMVIPTFRGDVRVRGARIFGINTVLFLLNTILMEVKCPEISINVALNVILRDKWGKIPDDLLDYERLHREKYGQWKEGEVFRRVEDLDLFPGGLVWGKGRSGPSANSGPGSDKNSSGPIAFSIPVNECIGKIFQTLLAFFRSKDDNMLLINTNILIYLFTNYSISFDGSIDSTSEKLFELLEMDPSFRLVTSENICQLLSIIARQRAEAHLTFYPPKLTRLLRTKLGNLRKLLKSPHFLDLITNKFKKVALTSDSPAFFNQPRPLNLNWLALFNYNFSSLSSKDLRYLDLSYKLELTEEEFVEVEIRTFFLFKNLRYRICPDSVILESEQHVPTIYAESFARVDNPNFKDGATIQIDFDQERLLSRLFSATCPEVNGAKVYLASFGRDLLLLEEVDRDRKVYRIIFREYYTNVIVYVHRSNQRQLNLSLKNKIQFWALGFPSVQQSLQSKNLVDDLCADFKKDEGKFVETILTKFELDLPK